MADQWYVRVRGKQSGPFSAADLMALARAGRLLPDHQVRQGAQGQWLSARRVKGLFATADVTPKPEAPKPTVPKPATPDVVAPDVVAPKTATIPLESVGESVDGAPSAHRITAVTADGGIAAPAQQPDGAFTLAGELDPKPPTATNRPTMQIETSGDSPASKRIAGGGSDRTVEVFRMAILSLMLGVVGICFYVVPLVPIVLAIGAALLALRALGRVAQARESAKMLIVFAMLVSVVAGGLGVYTTLTTDHPLDRLRAMFSVSSPRTHDSDTWYNAAHEAVLEGSVHVSISEASIGTYRAAEGKSETSEAEYLFISVILENQGEKNKADYFSWSEAVAQRGEVPRLVDDAGNAYFPVSFGRRLAEQTGFSSLYPGDKVRDLLVFQPPVESFSYLHLSLPARALGSAGQIRFELPRTFVQILPGNAPAKKPDRPADSAQPPGERNPLETIEIKREPEDAPEQPIEKDGGVPGGAEEDGEASDGAEPATTAKSPATERDISQ